MTDRRLRRKYGAGNGRKFARDRAVKGGAGEPTPTRKRTWADEGRTEAYLRHGQAAGGGQGDDLGPGADVEFLAHPLHMIIDGARGDGQYLPDVGIAFAPRRPAEALFLPFGQAWRPETIPADADDRIMIMNGQEMQGGKDGRVDIPVFARDIDCRRIIAGQDDGDGQAVLYAEFLCFREYFPVAAVQPADFPPQAGSGLPVNRFQDDIILEIFLALVTAHPFLGKAEQHDGVAGWVVHIDIGQAGMLVEPQRRYDFREAILQILQVVCFLEPACKFQYVCESDHWEAPHVMFLSCFFRAAARCICLVFLNRKYAAKTGKSHFTDQDLCAV